MNLGRWAATGLDVQLATILGNRSRPTHSGFGLYSCASDHKAGHVTALLGS